MLINFFCYNLISWCRRIFWFNKHSSSILFNIICYFSGSSSCLYFFRYLNILPNCLKLCHKYCFCFNLTILNGICLLPPLKKISIWISCLSCFVFFDFWKSLCLHQKILFFFSLMVWAFSFLGYDQPCSWMYWSLECIQQCSSLCRCSWEGSWRSMEIYSEFFVWITR